MLERQPLVVIEAVKVVVIAFLPLAHVFNLINWSTEQFAAVETFVAILASSIGTLFQWRRVTPISGAAGR